MAFKDSLLKKIDIEKLAARVAATVEPQADAAKFDKASARRLIEMGDAVPVHLDDRGLELYILEDDGVKKRIIVLDNGLAIYHTTIEDVALRKSPTVKEMISLRNVRKILSDSDVLISKRSDSVRTLKEMLLDGLDLTYTEADIDGIAYEGAASLDGNDADGVLQSLRLFSEILGFQTAPKLFQSAGCDIRGDVQKGATGETRFGPCVAYDSARHAIKLISATLDSRSEEDLDRYRRILGGVVRADAEGTDVFRHLKQLVMDRKPVLGKAA